MGVGREGVGGVRNGISHQLERSLVQNFISRALTIPPATQAKFAVNGLPSQARKAVEKMKKGNSQGCAITISSKH